MAFLASFFVVHFVAKRYILQQKCQKGQIGTCVLGTPWCGQTDGQTDNRMMPIVLQYYCVAVRSAKNDINIVCGCRRLILSRNGWILQVLWYVKVTDKQKLYVLHCFISCVLSAVSLIWMANKLPVLYLNNVTQAGASVWIEPLLL